MTFSVVVSGYWADQHYLQHAIHGLMRQNFKDFEVIVTIRLKEGMVRLAHDNVRNTIPCNWLYTDHDHSFSKGQGNRERSLALRQAMGSYVTWLSIDNLVYPNWLSCHFENFQKNPDLMSFVNIDYFRHGHYYGKLPTSIAYSGVDLLNLALPTDLAREIDAFGPEMEREECSDWRVVERALKKGGKRYSWNPEQPICACHF